VRKEKTL
jgi:hypothetical protein